MDGVCGVIFFLLVLGGASFTRKLCNELIEVYTGDGY